MLLSPHSEGFLLSKSIKTPPSCRGSLHPLSSTSWRATSSHTLSHTSPHMPDPWLISDNPSLLSYSTHTSSSLSLSLTPYTLEPIWPFLGNNGMHTQVQLKFSLCSALNLPSLGGKNTASWEFLCTIYAERCQHQPGKCHTSGDDAERKPTPSFTPWNKNTSCNHKQDHKKCLQNNRKKQMNKPNHFKSLWGATLLLCSSVHQLAVARFAMDLTARPLEGLGGQMLP